MDGVIKAEAEKAISILKRFCKETGCLYCDYCEIENQDPKCTIGTPREWRVENNDVFNQKKER